LNFMGYELATWNEWNPDRGVEWDLLDHDFHQNAKYFVKDLNTLYLEEKALWEKDCNPEGFQWIDVDNAEQSILSFIRRGSHPLDELIIIMNFTPQTYSGYTVGAPLSGSWNCIFNSDSENYGGSNFDTGVNITAQETPWQNQPCSLSLNIPPLACIILKKGS
ncbi:MAG: alpha amylase C-terminal domain-containing protein, partial [Candidatus Marinimicrobia bacterium]|nr:alpha amylase C-terminal domain-containing protein [Candidatus Neomarinimicrobiota bacterium]